MEGWIFSHFQKFGWATKAGEKDGLQKKLVSWQYSTMEFSCELPGNIQIHVIFMWKQTVIQQTGSSQWIQSLKDEGFLNGTSWDWMMEKSPASQVWLPECTPGKALPSHNLMLGTNTGWPLRNGREGMSYCRTPFSSANLCDLNWENDDKPT